MKSTLRQNDPRPHALFKTALKKRFEEDVSITDSEPTCSCSCSSRLAFRLNSLQWKQKDQIIMRAEMHNNTLFEYWCTASVYCLSWKVTSSIFMSIIMNRLFKNYISPGHDHMMIHWLKISNGDKDVFRELLQGATQPETVKERLLQSVSGWSFMKAERKQPD